MKTISIDNGHSTTTPEQAVKTIPWAAIVQAMDDKTREKVCDMYAPETEEEFLRRYLEIAPEDIVIG